MLNCSRKSRARLLVASALAALVLLGSRPASAADTGTGTIKGRLVWGGAEALKSTVLVAKGDANKKDSKVCAAEGDLLSKELVVDPKTKGVASGFAYLVKPKGKNADAEKALVAKTGKVEIDQKSCEFIPHSMAFHQDQKLLFKSSDPVNHNIRYSGFAIAAGNVALPPTGQFEVKLKADSRPISLNCDIHPWMTGKMMVFDHPFFTVTGDDGTFEIKGVPAGEENIVLWHEKVGFVTTGKAKGQAVKVEAGKTVDIGDVKIDPKAVK